MAHLAIHERIGHLRAVSLWRAVVARARSDIPFLFAVWLLLASATTLLAAGALYGDTVQDGSLHQAVSAARPSDRAVRVRLSAQRSEAESISTTISAVVDHAFDPAAGDVALETRSAALKPAGPAQPDASAHLTALASIEDIERHATLLRGSWPQAGQQPVQAVLSEGAAAELGLDVGATVPLADATTPGADPTVAIAEVQLVGIWRPDREDPFWFEDPQDLDGIVTNGVTTYRGPYVVAAADLLADEQLVKLEFTWHGVLDVPHTHVEQLPTVRANLAGLPDRVRGSLPDKRFVTVDDRLVDVLAGIGGSVLVARSGVVLLTLQFAVVALYAVLLVGGILIERRRAEVGLMRSRGATTGHIAALAFGEAVLLAVPAGLVAPFLAVLVVQLIGNLGPLAAAGITQDVELTSTTVVVAAIATVISILALVLPTLVAETDLARIRAALGRPVAQTLPQRLGIDLVLVVIAVIGIWQLRLYGAPLTRDARGAFGLDPLLVAAPAFALAAGAVLATRLVPRLAELAEHVLGRRRGLVPPLGARQLARRPLRYTRSALLLMLAAALGTFAAAFAATWGRSQVDQAAYRAPAQIQASQAAGADLPAWGLGSAYRAIPGVEAATPVTHGAMDVGRVVRGGDLLILDPAAITKVATFPADLEGRSVDGMLAAMAGSGAERSLLPVDGEPLRLAISLDARLRRPKEINSIPIAKDARGISVGMLVQDADGRLQHFVSTELALLRDRDQQVVVPISTRIGDLTVTPAFPIRIMDVEVTVLPPLAATLEGTVDVLGIAQSPSADAEEWTAVPFDPSSLDWSFEDAEVARAERIPQASSVPARIEIGVGTSTVDLGNDGPQEVPPTFRLWHRPTPEIVPAIASEEFLRLTQTTVGDEIDVRISLAPIKVRIVGATSIFPTLAPAKPFLIAESSSLELDRMLQNQGTGTFSTDWWLRTDADREAEVARRLRDAPFTAATVTSREAVTRSLEGDPVALGFVGALALGALAAISFAGLGFLVSTVVSTRERLGEFALLRALGMSRRQLTGWLSMEEAALLVVGLATGIGLGLLVAWLVLPFATLNATGGAVIPPPVIVVPSQAIALAVVLALVLLVLTAVAVTRQVRRSPIVDVLRGRDE